MRRVDTFAVIADLSCGENDSLGETRCGEERDAVEEHVDELVEEVCDLTANIYRGGASDLYLWPVIDRHDHIKIVHEGASNNVEYVFKICHQRVQYSKVYVVSYQDCCAKGRHVTHDR